LQPFAIRQSVSRAIVTEGGLNIADLNIADLNTISFAIPLVVSSVIPDLRTLENARNVGQQREAGTLMTGFLASPAAGPSLRGQDDREHPRLLRGHRAHRALGAQRGSILALVLWQGLGLAITGIAIGIAGAAVLTRLLNSMLFGVKALDPVTFTLAAMLFVTVALAASYIPARRAAAIEPMAALRNN
jgi:hypothetical protein